MSSLDRAVEILELARDLGLASGGSPVERIVAYCVAKVEAWLALEQPPTSVNDIQAVVCRRLGLVFEDVYSDADLEHIVTKYVSQGEYVFAHLRQSLNNWTFAELIERQNPPEAPDHFVAVIDCRGDEKRARSFFTRWHEIAHLLVLTPRMTAPFNRDSTERCPLERLMDVIAGELGFYRPVFRPALEQCLAQHGQLCFQAIEDLRAAYCPTASFHATAIAAVKAYDRPAVLVEARHALKAHEQRAATVGTAHVGRGLRVKPKLRAVSVMMNAAAQKAGIRIDRNMEIPANSIIVHALSRGDETVVCGNENLCDWLHSDGSSLPEAPVFVEASATAERSIAVITTREPKTREASAGSSKT